MDGERKTGTHNSVHTDIGTVIFGESVVQFILTFGKGRKVDLLIFRTNMEIGNADTGKDGFSKLRKG